MLTKKTNAFLSCPDANDSTAWWRVHQPFFQFERDDPLFHAVKFDFLRSQALEPHNLERAHFVMVQRAFMAAHAEVLSIARTCLRPTWVDYDDNIWCVPRVNPAVEYYTEQAQAIARIACQNASAVTVSTEYLANYIQDRVAPDSQIDVVSNALPDNYTWNTYERDRIVLYRGGKTHVADLMGVTPDLEEVMREYPDWTFVFCGGDPWFVNLPPNARVIPMRAIPDFHRWLYSCKASIMIVPLEDCPFNRSKSNISWLEGTYAGAAVLAPDFEVFREPGCANYTDGDFGDRLRDMIDCQEDARAGMVAESRRTIDAKYRMTNSNRIRERIMEEMNP